MLLLLLTTRVTPLHRLNTSDRSTTFMGDYGGGYGHPSFDGAAAAAPSAGFPQTHGSESDSHNGDSSRGGRGGGRGGTRGGGRGGSAPDGAGDWTCPQCANVSCGWSCSVST